MVGTARVWGADSINVFSILAVGGDSCRISTVKNQYVSVCTCCLFRQIGDDVLDCLRRLKHSLVCATSGEDDCCGDMYFFVLDFWQVLRTAVAEKSCFEKA